MHIIGKAAPSVQHPNHGLDTIIAHDAGTGFGGTNAVRGDPANLAGESLSGDRGGIASGPIDTVTADRGVFIPSTDKSCFAGDVSTAPTAHGNTPNHLAAGINLLSAAVLLVFLITWCVRRLTD